MQLSPQPPASVQASSLTPPTFHLPPPGPLYTGRDEDAEILTYHILARAICVSGSTGVGRLTLCLDLGARIHRAGACPAGSRMVDLRDVRSMEGALKRLCGALDMSMDDNAFRRVPARLASLAHKYDGRMLLLVANAEGMARGSDALHFKELVIQVAKEAVLLMTSVVPVAEEHIRQHVLQSLSPLAGQQLLQQIAPTVDLEFIRAALQLCLGRPLLIRLIGEALASKRLTIQDVHDSAVPPGGDQPVATMHLALRLLPPQQRTYLELLTVFPSSFDLDGAKAVLNLEGSEASNVLGLLSKQGLVSNDITNGVYSMHTAVRKPLLESATPGTKSLSQKRFAVYIFEVFSSMATLYFSKCWKTSLTYTRSHEADLTEAFKLAGKLICDSEQSAHLLPLILTMDSEAGDQLLQAAGVSKGTWIHLRDILKHCQGQQEEQAAALYIQHLSMGNKEAYDVVAKAFELSKEALGQVHALSASCLFAMAHSLWKQFRDDARLLSSEAAPLSKEAADLRKKAIGEDARTHIYVAREAACSLEFGHRDLALSLGGGAVAGLKKLLGPDHPRTLGTLHNLACAQAHGRNDNVAEAMYREVFEAQLNVMGIDHTETLRTLNNLARTLRCMGQHAEAEKLHREALEGRQKILDLETCRR